MDKLKVSIELEESWNREDFRLFSKQLAQNESIELYIITTVDDEDIVDAAQAYLDLEDSHVIEVATDALKLDEIEDKAVRIHLDNDPDFANTLYDTIGRVGVYVSQRWDYYNSQLRYVTDFDFRVKQIIDAQEDC